MGWTCHFSEFNLKHSNAVYHQKHLVLPKALIFLHVHRSTSSKPLSDNYLSSIQLHFSLQIFESVLPFSEQDHMYPSKQQILMFQMRIMVRIIQKVGYSPLFCFGFYALRKVHIYLPNCAYLGFKLMLILTSLSLGKK